MKKVLMITYYFPPTGGPAVQRSLFFAKYLPQAGYLPLVVQGTVRPRRVRDDSLLWELDPHVRRFEFRGTEPAALTHPVSVWMHGHLGRLGDALAWRLRWATAYVARRLSPDPLVYWARRLVEPVTRLARRCGASVIYSTADPFSNHYLAWRVKQRTGLPWVADFRDLWTQDRTYDARPAYRARRDRRLERTFLAEADAVTCVSQAYCRAMRRLADPARRDRFHVIPNGADLSGFPRPGAPPSSNGPFVLSYVGTLYPTQWSEPLVRAVRRLVDEEGDGRFRWQVVGRIQPPRLADELAALGPAYAFRDYVPHDEAVDTMVRSDALLLVIPRGPFADGVITGKLFEYLASGRPILCLTPVDGEAARMVRAHGAGVVADIDDEREIYAGLRALYDDWKAGRPRRGADRDAIRGYDRAHLAGRLASLFDAVTAEAGDRPSEGSARPVGSLAEA